MEGKSPEILNVTEKPDLADTGFSEKRAARILEGKRMDNSQVKKQKPIVFSPKQKILKRAARVEPSVRERIIKAHHENARALIALVEALGVLAKGSLRQEEHLLGEICTRQKMQNELLQALLLESRDQALPKAVEDLIK